MRIDGLINHINGSESTLEVVVHRTDLRDFVIITDPADNRGLSITNGVECFLPQIAKTLGLDPGRCVWVESYPPSDVMFELDPTFDRIQVKRWCGSTIKPDWSVTPLALVELEEHGWRPLGLPLARALQELGVTLSYHLGRDGVFRRSNGETYTARIAGYDGRTYFGSSEEPLSGRLISVLYRWDGDLAVVVGSVGTDFVSTVASHEEMLRSLNPGVKSVRRVSVNAETYRYAITTPSALRNWFLRQMHRLALAA